MDGEDIVAIIIVVKVIFDSSITIRIIGGGIPIAIDIFFNSMDIVAIVIVVKVII